MSRPIWVFGYGSLVSPASIGRTLGRTVDRGDGWRVAQLEGWGRRWNYGSATFRGDWHHDDVEVRAGVVVSLGLTPTDETCNGVAFRVSDDELALLDHRERDYDGTDVTDGIVAESGPVDGRVVTFVPRPSAVERYERARDEQRAAVRREYWDLVHHAFAELGGDHLDRLSNTPAPDVPVVDVTVVRIDGPEPDHHRPDVPQPGGTHGHR